MLNSDQDYGVFSADSDQELPDTDWYVRQIGIAQLLREAHRSLSRALAARISNSGVSIGQWYFLRALWHEDGLTQRELSQRVGMMEPTTVTALNGMEKRGLVERVRNVQDRRKMNIFLTDKGRSLQAQLQPLEDEISKLAIRGIPPQEKDMLLRLLKLVILNLNDEER
ncbi:MAG: MarR family transcriptional regulator [Alphaproteobacteria bacterium]|nr:MarR family transcriptional regulator [Alphaproteobacteria bacterium]